ncbi:FAD-dependent monooxygenase [Streptomyces sp. SP18ES09]|uniref:FAD-dependent monooxygenase n=1 Tax=Streptomyces sp. SP18ES09 TaxID=3002532 RepID=UPI002E7AA0B5|nr:FAD-dependent monooxygenase [Streptomyces sp. SP18ES09]MEE1815436.1 FAD-dependent monooxygenase [Streptomyces sp. SP18ES09]
MAHHRTTTDVLIVGAGPVGLSAAAELRRHGVHCRLVDRLPARLPYAKAVGIQPRTLELWDRMGLVRSVLEAAVPLRGQLVYVDGRERDRIELTMPPEVPYGFAALPQYETERLLEEYVARRGTVIERGTELLSFTQDRDGVTARLRTASGADEELRVPYLIGCDGAHSVVRKTLGLSFEGGAFQEAYMLGDVVAEWDLPHAYGIRSSRGAADGSADVLVCIPLPGEGRYRMSMKLPPELAGSPDAGAGAGDGVAHGLQSGGGPGLADLQDVVDRLAPRPARLSGLRWSSVFRISHRIVDRYDRGRVFVAGDAAHIHPPTGAQGMNTGVQDACNLAWKLALVVRGGAGPELLGTYDAERRPVGEEVVGRTVRHAVRGIEADPEDRRTLLLREAQLLVGYRGGPLSGAPYGPEDAPQPGDRAPDCAGLTTPVAAFPLRLLDVLRDRPGHVVLLYGSDGRALADAAAAARTVGGLASVAVLAAGNGDGGDAGPVDPSLPVYRDAAGEFARLYLPDGATGFLVRPDGQLGARFPLAGTAAALGGCLRALSVRPDTPLRDPVVP